MRPGERGLWRWRIATAGTPYLKLRQAGEQVIAKPLHRLYVEERLQVYRRRRKKLPVADRPPLVKPTVPSEVWSADFVCDCMAEDRVPKYLATSTMRRLRPWPSSRRRPVGGLAVTRALDRLPATRDLPRVLRTNNGFEFCGKAMLTWAHERRVTLRQIEPGKPTQNAYTESFIGHFRDECLNEH